MKNMEETKSTENCESPPSAPTSPAIPSDVKPEKANCRAFSIARRREFGTEGERISLISNHFKISVNVSDAIFYQYTVSVTFDDKVIVGKGIGRKVFEKLYQTYSSELARKRLAYDGEKTLYSVGPLPQNKFDFTVVMEDSFTKCGSVIADDDGGVTNTKKRPKCSFQSRTYKVEISYAAKIPLKALATAFTDATNMNNSAQDALRVLDTVIRQQAASRGCLLVRQSFFHDDLMNSIDVGGGVTGIRGFHSSFHPTHGGLSLIMDVSTTMILKPGPVMDFLLANQDVKEPRNVDWIKAKKMLKNMRVKAIHRNIEFKIIGLSEKPCNQQLFLMNIKDGDSKGDTIEITVFDYFIKVGVELTWSAYMPCLDVGKPNRPNYLPLELCNLVSLQRYKRALSGKQRALFVEKSRQKPLERIKTLTDAVGTCCFDKDPFLIECGISIEKRFSQVEGRVLPAPKLMFGNNEEFTPRNGQWNFNNKKLLNPTRIEHWAIVNFSARCDTSLISRELINCGMKKGIYIDRPRALIEEDHQSRRANPVVRVEKMFEKMQLKFSSAPNFILCVLPEKKNSNIYGPWKKKILCDIGIVTQCISPSKISDQYLTNVLLKMNSKLGGINTLLVAEQASSIPLINKIPTMILGMDVSHGSPSRLDAPSVAAVVGSRCWPLISRYRASVRTQSPKVEMIDSLYKPNANGDDEGIMSELLLEFYVSSQGRKPKQIIIFRDGVSESQFNQVLTVELEQIIKTYEHLGESDSPKFTVIVAQKNHHTKLFQAGGPNNIPPGTVVDSNIVHPRNYDFYMCAHPGKIGTSRPAHYHVLLDEIGFSTDELQNLIHSLSYANQRSTTAASIVAPIWYAHLAAAQMGQFVNLENLSDMSSESRVSSESDGPKFPEIPPLHPNVENSMFFC